MKILAIDLGGTTAKVALVENDEISRRWTIPTDVENIFQNIKDNLGDLNIEEVDRIGLSMPGFINHETGVVKISGNLKLKDFDTKKEFQKIFGKEVYVLNDANAAAMGEYWKGAGSEFASIVFYTIGTGIGGGLIINNKLVYGNGGYAGEFGHAGIMQTKFKCSCGLKNCVEPVSSATGIEKILSKHFGKKTTIKEIAHKIETKDPEITNLLKEALMPLASHMAVMQTAINPDAIIIGGGPSALGQPLIDIISGNLKDMQLPFIQEATKLLVATTKNDAGIYGATIWAKNEGR
ncbi:ROK family protein [Mycoplasma todarodis]|uniref:ROK family protein n=1 Tax=Mycoplasma todarodis TaxID=1937191 RepID=UPI003B33FE89